MCIRDRGEDRIRKEELGRTARETNRVCHTPGSAIPGDLEDTSSHTSIITSNTTDAHTKARREHPHRRET
eukprot:8275158-Prorocentrum_lima.AAC.1